MTKSTEGEGSRGGVVIGHTASGNPIYESEKERKPHSGNGGDPAAHEVAQRALTFVSSAPKFARLREMATRAEWSFDAPSAPWNRTQGVHVDGDDAVVVLGYGPSGDHVWGRVKGAGQALRAAKQARDDAGHARAEATRKFERDLDR